jgi:hypothetical protein
MNWGLGGSQKHNEDEQGNNAGLTASGYFGSVFFGVLTFT